MVEYYNGEEVVEFITKCPVDGCDNNEEIHWVHSGCGEKEYINSDGIIICSKCGDRTSIFDRKFKCQKHGDYKPPSSSLSRLIGAFLNFGNSRAANSQIFLAKLVNNFHKQCH